MEGIEGRDIIYEDFRPIIASSLAIVAAFAYFLLFLTNFFIPKSTLAQKKSASGGNSLFFKSFSLP